VAAPVAAPVLSQSSENQAQAQASQEKVKEMAQKLGIPFTANLLALGSNSAISDALIEKAVAAGKSEAQINAAMASL
jgi:cytochrome c-type biogenesis protein CcmH/NrfF